MTPEERTAYNKNYYLAHRDQIRAHQKAYYQGHRDQIRAYQKAYYQGQRERVSRKNPTLSKRMLRYLRMQDAASYESNKREYAERQSILRAYRKKRGVTKEQLAKVSGYSISAIQMFEIGGRRADVEKMLAAIDAASEMAV